MIIKQLYIDNPARNFNYLLVCEATNQALAIDPLNAKLCFEVAQKHGWDIKQILNTHEHWDHIGGNKELLQATEAELLAPANAPIPDIDRHLQAGDIIKVGTSIELSVLDTPGHTLSHVCVLTSSGTQPALFSGDTLFNAGCGNCVNGGCPETLFTTFAQQLNKLPGNTKVYPGHDYIVNNINFALSIEPDNKTAQSLKQKLVDHDPHHALILCLDEEKEINPFFRLDNLAIINHIQQKFPELTTTDSKAVFLALRELRNSW